MPAVPASRLSDVDFEGINLSVADFTDAKDEGATIPSGEIGEIMRAEVEEDGQLASYSHVRLGDRLDDGNGDSAKGKLFAQLADPEGEDLDPRTEFRFVTRLKNGNRRTALTEFIKLRNANLDDPSKRLPFTPVSIDGKPAVVKAGRIIAVEVRNAAEDVEVSRAESDMDIPARGGY